MQLSRKIIVRKPLQTTNFFFYFRRRAAEQKAKAENLQVLEVPAELAFMLSKIDEWQPPHTDKNITKVRLLYFNLFFKYKIVTTT